jgi:Tfp pilus assembly protein PilN
MRPDGRRTETVRELEFLPPDYIQARYQRRIGFIRSWLLLAMGMAMVLWSFQMGAWVRNARAELESLQGSDQAMQPDVLKVHHQRTEAQTYEQRLEMARSLQPRVTATEIMTAVAEVLPDTVRLDEALLDCAGLSPSDRVRVRLTGVALSETAVTHTLSALEDSPKLERAVLLESKAVPGSEAARSFVIEADVVLAAAAAKE